MLTQEEGEEGEGEIDESGEDSGVEAKIIISAGGEKNPKAKDDDKGKASDTSDNFSKEESDEDR